MITKTIGVLILELVIYYVLGSGIATLLYKKKLHMGIRIIFGLLCYQAAFEANCLVFVFRYGLLGEMITSWNRVLILLVILSAVLGRKTIAEDGKQLRVFFQKSGVWTFIGLGIVCALCVYVSVNGELDYDSEYYIGLVTTTLYSKYLFRINAYTGVMLPSLYGRRMFVTFEMDTAYLCKQFGLKAIVAMRVLRGSMDVILTSMAIFEIGTFLYRKKENAIQWAWKFLTVALLCYFLFEQTMYTNGTFFLHRAYEGKAFAGNALLYYVVCLAIIYYKERDRRLVLILLLSFWGFLAVSTTAVVLCGSLTAVLLAGMVVIKLMKAKEKKLCQE